MSDTVDAVFTPLFQATQTSGDDIAAYSKTMNPTNPADLLAFQQKMTDYTVTMGAASASLHALAQMMQQIVQKIG